jgi:hypothetical protein
MKHKILLCSILLMLSFASLASAKNLAYKNIAEVGNWSSLSKATSTSISLNELPYKNILDAAKWSRLTNGRALTASLRKRNAHRFPEQDPDVLFAVGSGGGGGCNWGCCFKRCVRNSLDGVLCAGGCGSCFADGSAYGCAVCAACGAVAVAAVEMCSIGCCMHVGGC